MISFRFHIVSLTAVFLALAIGIGIGATVVDQATVDTIRSQLRNVERRADATNQRNDALQSDLDQWRRFGDDGALELVRGRLDIPVLLVGVQGVDRELVDALRQSVAAAGGRLQGTVWLTSKLQLDNPEDVQALQAILGVTAARPDTLRRTLAGRLAAGWTPESAPSVLPALRDADFVDFEAPESATVDLNLIGAPGTFFVVVSDADPDLPNDQVAVPFVTALAERVVNHIVAVEPGRAATDERPAQRAVFLAPLRADGSIAARISTVDNLEDIRGRIATVLALDALSDAQPRTGHFGVGSGTRALPEPSP
jgi:hypothetical protein